MAPNLFWRIGGGGREMEVILVSLLNAYLNVKIINNKYVCK